MVLPQGGEQFVQQERVASAHPAAGAAELRGRVGEPLRPHELLHRTLAQRCRPQAQAARMDAQPAEQVLGGVRLAGADGDQHAQRHLLELAHRMAEEAQGRPVGPLGVVDDQHQPLGTGPVRARPGEVHRQPVQALDQGAGLPLAERQVGDQRGSQSGAARDAGPESSLERSRASAASSGGRTS